MQVIRGSGMRLCQGAGMTSPNILKQKQASRAGETARSVLPECRPVADETGVG